MKEKIFARLKQAYSSLGLGDEILQAHAESLASLGLVTDANLDVVIGCQKGFLEGLQKSNDKRAAEAAKTARENAKKEFDEETKKKAEEAKKAEEEAAKKKAEEDAKKKAEADAKAAEEAKKKAAEEEEAKRLEELKKQQEIPAWFIKAQEDAAARAKAEREEAEKRAAEQAEAAKKLQDEYLAQLKALQEQNATLTKSYETMKSDNEKAAAEAAKRQRADYILSKARELHIPQSRIDEGFVIADNADETTINEYLGKVANNIKVSQLPTDTNKQIDANDGDVKEQMAALAKQMIK